MSIERWMVRVVWPAVVAAVGLGVVISGGCDTVAFIGRKLSDRKQYTVKAKYDGLENQRVAVLVSAGQYMRFRYPNAASNTTRMVSTRLAEHVPGIKVTNPRAMDRYRKQHRYWPTMPYAKLVDQLEVDRLVVIDLTEYRTHKPGNRHLWEGVMSGSIGVVAQRGSAKTSAKPHANAKANPKPDAKTQRVNHANQSPNNAGQQADHESTALGKVDPNDFVFHDVVGVRFPPGEKVGLLDQDRQTMQIGMLSLFGRDVVRLFYQHKVSGEELRKQTRRSLEGP